MSPEEKLTRSMTTLLRLYGATLPQCMMILVPLIETGTMPEMADWLLGQYDRGKQPGIQSIISRMLEITGSKEVLNN